MFKVNNKDTKTTPLVSFWCLYCWLLTYFLPCSSVSIVNFEKVNAYWDEVFRRCLRLLVNVLYAFNLRSVPRGLLIFSTFSSLPSFFIVDLKQLFYDCHFLFFFWKSKTYLLKNILESDPQSGNISSSMKL